VVAVVVLTVIQLPLSGRFEGDKAAGLMDLEGLGSLGSSRLAAFSSREDSSEKADPRLNKEFNRESRLRKLAEATVKNRKIQTELSLETPKILEPPKPPKLPLILAKVAVIIAATATLLMLFIIGFQLFTSWRMKKLIFESDKDNSNDKAKDTEARIKKALEVVEGDADKLADSGRYTEAMHTLLLVGIEQFKRRNTKLVPATYTARELLLVLPLNKDENEAFADLVKKVEPTWFGPMEGTVSDYQGARASFQKLLGQVGATVSS
jgi:hypothetical protein